MPCLLGTLAATVIGGPLVYFSYLERNQEYQVERERQDAYYAAKRMKAREEGFRRGMSE